MTIKEAINFDKAFVLARIQECVLCCEFQIKQGFPNPDLFTKLIQQGFSWSKNYGYKTCLLPHELSDIEDHLHSLNQAFLTHNSLLDLEEDEFLEQVQAHNEKSKPVSEPSTSKKLPMLCVLGQVVETSSPGQALAFKSASEQLFSNTRSVGGLA